jgi:glycosyltransferase 2 family protein
VANFIVIFFIGLAIGAPASLKHYLVFLPIITVMTMLPVSIGGLGVRESALVALFVPVGLTPGQSVTLGLLWHAVAVVASLPGGWIYLTYRRNQVIPKLSGALLAADEP